MATVKLFKDFDKNDLIFKPVRKTATGSRIIDVDGDTLFQTSWLKILYDVDYSICVDSEKIKDTLSQIDQIVIERASNSLDFSKEEIVNMYRPLLKQSGDSNCFCVSILTGTTLFDKDKNFYDKPEIKNVLRPGQSVRFIFGFKKIYFKDHELTFQLELQQIEVA
jgi:outer membrane protein assembly factor BamB